MARAGRDPAAFDAHPLWYNFPRPLFTGGNTVRLLRGGDALFPAMIEAISTALHDVWLSTYIFHDDEAAESVARALVQAARRGVRVRVVVDGFGSNLTLFKLTEWLQAEGLGFAVFRPLHRWWNWLQPSQLRRLHHKLCVIDGQIGFVGGINLVDDRNDLRHGRTEEPRLDYAVELRGPVVVPIEQTIRAMWTRAVFGHDWMAEVAQLARSARPVERARRLLQQLRIHPKDTTLIGAAEDHSPVRAAFVVRDNLRQRRAIERSYVDAIRSAKKRIDIMSPYFYPGRRFRHALRRASARGVDVRLLLQGKLDYRIAGVAAVALYDELVRHGVRIFEYTPAYLHAKVAMIDDEWATVGSSNIDPLSLLLNLEANVVIQDKNFCHQLRREFDDAVAVSREVDAVKLRAGGFWRVLMRGVIAWCAYVYLRVAGTTGRY